MKKVLALSLLCCLVLSMFACRENENPHEPSSPENETEQTTTETKVECFLSEFRPHVLEPSDDLDSPSCLIVETKAMADKIYAESIQKIKNDYVTMVPEVSETGHEEFISIFLEMHEGLVKTFAHFDESFFENYKLFFVGLKRYGTFTPSTVKAYIDPKQDVLYVDIISGRDAVAFGEPGGPFYTTAAVWIDKEVAEQYAENMVIRNIQE